MKIEMPKDGKALDEWKANGFFGVLIKDDYKIILGYNIPYSAHTSVHFPN